MPQHLLTDLALRKLRPTDTDQYIKDGGGLWVRIQPETKTKREPRILFQYRYKHQGRSRVLTLGSYPQTSLAEARQRRDDAARLRDQRIDPVIRRAETEEAEAQARLAKKNEKTVQDIYSDWMKVYVLPHRKRPEQIEEFMKRDVLPFLGKRRARSISRSDIVSVIDQIVNRGARVKANRVLSMIKQMFGHAEARGYVDINPASPLKRKHAGGLEKPRDRHLSEDEIRELFRKLPESSLPESYQLIITLQLATAQRPAEVIEALIEEFDLPNRLWTIPAHRSKNGKPHKVHLSDLTLKIVKNLISRSKGIALLPSRDNPDKPLDRKAVAKAIRDRQRAVALKNRAKPDQSLRLYGGEWTLHTLRHTANTRMGDLGIPPYIVEKILNHTLPGIMAVYNHQEYLPDRQFALCKWGEHLLALGAGCGGISKVD